MLPSQNQPALKKSKRCFDSYCHCGILHIWGKNVMLMMDSVTRFAMAQREIGLAIQVSH